MTVRRGTARVVSGRPRVVREVRAAGPLAAHLRAPLTARGPWLTAVLGVLSARRSTLRPVAVVVDDPAGEAPAAAAFLAVRPGLRPVVRLLTSAAGPAPGGRPPARLLARDEAAADALADGIVGVLAGRPGPWRLDLGGLPLGDPTVRALAARLPTATLATERSVRLVDDLGGAVRSTDPREVDRRLSGLLPPRPRLPSVRRVWSTPPELVPELPARADRGFVRAVVRLHAALGAVEVAVPADGRGGLVTLVDDEDRWPWWGSALPGLRTEMGSPLVRLTAEGWSGRAVSGRGGTR